jgi:hypothetical protein
MNLVPARIRLTEYGKQSYILMPAISGGAAMSDYLEQQLRNHLFRTATFAKPAAIYVGLFTVTPSDVAGSGTEVTGGNYGRAFSGTSAPLDANWTAVSTTDGVTDNAQDITFPVPSANWGTIVAFGIFDASTAGNMLIWGALTASKTVNNGDPAPKFVAGALDITFA